MLTQNFIRVAAIPDAPPYIDRSARRGQQRSGCESGVKTASPRVMVFAARRAISAISLSSSADCFIVMSVGWAKARSSRRAHADTTMVGTRSLSSGRPKAGPVGFAHPTSPMAPGPSRCAAPAGSAKPAPRFAYFLPNNMIIRRIAPTRHRNIIPTERTSYRPDMGIECFWREACYVCAVTRGSRLVRPQGQEWQLHSTR
jgi:hypothetical protein